MKIIFYIFSNDMWTKPRSQGHLLGFSFIINLGWKVAGGEGSFFVPVPKIYQFHINLWQGRNLLSAFKVCRINQWEASVLIRLNQSEASIQVTWPVWTNRRPSQWLANAEQSEGGFGKLLSNSLSARGRLRGCYCGPWSLVRRDADANNTFVNHL